MGKFCQFLTVICPQYDNCRVLSFNVFIASCLSMNLIVPQPSSKYFVMIQNLKINTYFTLLKQYFSSEIKSLFNANVQLFF